MNIPTPSSMEEQRSDDQVRSIEIMDKANGEIGTDIRHGQGPESAGISVEGIHRSSSSSSGSQQHHRWAALLSLLVIGSFGAFCSPSFASAPGPGWALSAHTAPTNLRSPIDEVQELAVDAEGGTFILVFKGQETGEIAFNVSPAGLQAELETLASIGTGNVSVSGSPGKYQITFEGPLGGRAVPEIEAFGEGLTGGEESVSVEVKTEGAASGMIELDVFNVGAAASEGTITVTDTLPVGVTAKEAGELVRPGEAGINYGIDPEIHHNLWDCTGNGPGAAPKVDGATQVTCTNDPEGLPRFAGGGGLPAGPNAPGPNLQPPIGISLEASGEGTGTNHAAIAGGGAPAPASTQDPVTVSSSPAPFQFTGWDVWYSNADGTLATQAGSHPYEATFSFSLSTALDSNREGYLPGGEPRNVETQLPPGFLGNPLAVAQCSLAQLNASPETCPQASQVGDVEVKTLSGISIVRRLFSLTPPGNAAAEFGFNFEGVLVFLDATARTGGDYGITTRVNNIPQRVAYQSIVTLWGQPGDASHNLWRAGKAGGCSQEEIEHSGPIGGNPNACAEPQFPIKKPFLTLPTTCGDPQPFLIRVLSGWQDPGAHAEATVLSHDSSGNPVGFTGCENLAFGPGLTLTPESAVADSPTGLTADAKVPLGGLEEPGLLAPSNIKHVTVTLPEGMVVNPGQAAGLQACQENTAQSAIGTENAAACPPASKIGTAKIKSPLLESAVEKEFEGNVYLLQSNPPEIHLLVAASADGVNLKLVGIAHLNSATGQITTTFGADPAVEAADPFLAGHLALPDLPASDFKLSFEGGAKAALVTPPTCGSYSSSADFTPQASPFIQDFISSPGPAFAITAGASGGACPQGPLPFTPSLAAGPTSTEAGAFTAFTQLLSRADGQQRVQSFSFTEPQGLAGLLSAVPLCAEAEANAGSCSAASKIGHAIVQSGPGSNPLTLPQPGGPEIPIYLTGPYKGAPFGLSIPAPIVAGPFNLGTITTRAKIDVDPHTAQITISTDPLPQIVDGVPTDIRSVYAVVDRSSFLFNPTNCTPSQFKGSATSTGGATAPLSSRFAIGACGALKFSPKTSAATPAHSSKADGAGLSVKISYPKGALTTQSWFSEAKLTFPKQLSARLTTIQKACTSQTFEANPAACPPASLIGRATVHTPVLPVPLTGPVYFVSFGAAKFPDVVMVLQGYGVTIVLRGETLIRSGITSATFKGTPDVPFDDIEVSIPQGPFSEFAANLPASAKGSFCGQKMAIKTEYKAQNGLTQNQQVPIAITGCARAISIRGHKVKGRTLTLTVAVPEAGKLSASGKGLSRASKKAKGAETLTLRLYAKKGGKLRSKVHLSFQPVKGKRLAKSMGVAFRG